MNKFIITNAGKALQTKLFDGATATFTKIVTTDQVYTEKEAASLSNFEKIRQISPVVEIQVIDDTTIEATAVIDNSKLEQGYTVNTLGLYAKENDRGEILFAVSLLGEAADQLPPAALGLGSAVTYKMKITVSDAANIQMNVSPEVFATQEAFEKHADNEKIHLSESEKSIVSKMGQNSDGELTFDGKEVKVKDSFVTSLLRASEWQGESSPFEQTLVLETVVADSYVELTVPSDITLEEIEAYQSACIASGTVNNGSITVNAYGEKPAVDLPLMIIVRGC